MLDEAQLSGENGQVYLFQWLSAAEKKPHDDRAEFEKALISIITASSPYPLPGRAIRNSVARCLVTLYSIGETRTLFDTLQAFIKLATSLEKDRDVVKIASFWCIGELMGVYGAQFMSFMAEIAVVSVKAYRSSSNHLLRYHALLALEKALRTAKRAVSEQTIKDLNKQLKSALTDKSWAVQRAATQILIILHSGQDAIPLTTSEVDAILSQSIKVLDNVDRFTRSAHARLGGHILAQTQVEGRKDISSSSATKPAADSANAAEADDAAISSTSAAAEAKSKALLTPYEAFLCLSNHINKASSSRKTRVGIFDFYSAFLVALGSEWVETNLSTLVQHLIQDLVAHPRLTTPTIPVGSASSAVIAQTGSPHRYEALLIRHLASILLRDLVEARMLSEQSQIATISEWSSAYLKRWPAMMPGQVEPKPSALVLGLRQVGGLVVLLGSAPSVVQNALSDPLVTLLSHPSHSVRMNAAWALRCFCASTPQRLAKTILTLSDKLSALLASLLTPTASTDVSTRALGHSYALAGLVSLIPHRPWYISYDVPSKVIDMAISLLKKAVDHAIPVATVEIEVAWRLLSGLMGLGKGFLRGYLPQLLVLWRNALPKITTKDNSAVGRTAQEWVFLMHVRECALGAIWCFLRSHVSTGPSTGGTGAGGGAGLVTLDVARRIAACLSNALAFANSFLSVANLVEDPYFAPPSDPSQASHRSGLPLREREALLRSRVFECFAFLVQPPTSVSASAMPMSAAPTGHGNNSYTTSAITDSTQDALMRSAISLFASAEGYGGSTVQAAIASSTGSFTSVWNGTDGYAYGVGWKVVKEVWSSDESDEGTTVDGAIDSFNHKSILGAAEHDPLSICLPSPLIEMSSTASNDGPSTSGASAAEASSLTQPTSPFYLPEPPPPATAVVDSAISLFSRLLPLQDATTTHKIIQLLIDEVRTTKLEKNAGRRAAIWINAIIALCLSLRNVSGQVSSNPGTRDTWASERVTTLLGQFLTEALTSDGGVGAGDPIIRAAASEAIGRLAAMSGTQYLASQIKNLVDSVVNNRTPAARAGCAWAFGAVHSHVGGLASGPLLKTTVNVLMSLANDPHGVVHLHALKALARVVDSASLGYAPHVSGTLGMLLRICLVDTHERETIGNRNGSGGLDLGEAGWGGDGGGAVDRAVCKVIDALIGVLGPDIVESTRTRGLILGLVNAFWIEGGGAASFGQQKDNMGGGGLYNVGTGVEAIKCIQHLLIFAPEHADIPLLVKRFRAHLASPSLALRPLKVASINALYQLVQKDAVAMSKLGGDRLVEDLFSLLDDGEEEGGVRRVIESWLTQTGILNPRAWIGLCQRIMGRTTAGQRVADSAQAGSGGDEGESLSGAVSASGGASGRTHQTSRWRTQLFALQCLHSICSLVAASERKEHLSAIVARAQGLQLENMLFSSVGDLIKMAFTASTAYVTEIRLAGLVVLRDVIETFAASPDPAYDDALLLEQHQAPITAALTPAFSSDSSPEILASAVNACAVFVGCGVVKDVSRMGRILKLLITALEQSKETGMLSLGDAGELSPNASAMLRISTLSAWAKLQVDSTRQKYLEDVLKPYRSTLASLWVSTLRDYASIRVDSEGLDVASTVLDSSYGTLGREVLLPYYAKSWSLILRAVATSMESNDPYVLAAMDGQEPPTTSKPTTPTLRKEPSALFFVLFGLVYEALATSAVDTTSLSAPTLAQRQSVLLSSLSALKSLVRPEYAGNAILSEPTIFDEFLSLSYRIAMTEPANIQALLVEVVQQWAVSSNPLIRQDPKADDDFLSLTAPPAHCLRLCAHIIKQTIGSRGTGAQAPDVILALRTCFSAYSSVLAMVPLSRQREDVRSIGILLFSELLKDESTEQDFVSPCLPTLKALLEVPVGAEGIAEAKERYSKLVNALLSSCLLNVDGMRGRSGAISRRKIKTNLLAAVLALTVVPPWVKIGREVVEHAVFLITQKMIDLDETTLTATHCAKTLILASAAGSPTLGQCTRLVLPGVIEFIAKLVPLVADGSLSEQHSTAISEVWKAFATLFANTADETRPRLLGVLIPVMLLPLSVSSPGQGPIITSLTTQTTHQLLAFAAASPAAFKEVTGKLDASSRELLEQSIRRVAGGAGAGGPGAAAAAAKPQITLKAF